MNQKINSFLNKICKTPMELELNGMLKSTFFQVLVVIGSIAEWEISRQLLEALFARNKEQLCSYGIIFVCAQLIVGGICYMEEYQSANVRGKIIFSLVDQILKKNGKLKSLYGGISASDKMSIADGDCERYADALLGRTSLIAAFIATICYIIYGFTINTWLTLLICISSIGLSFFNKKKKLRLYQNKEELNDRYGLWANYLWKALDNLEVIKVFLSKKQIGREQRRRNDSLSETQQKTLKTYLDVCLIEESSDMMFTMVILCLSFFSIMNHQMPASGILAMVETLNSVQKNIFKLPEQIIQWQELESIASRIYQLVSLEEDTATEELNEDFSSLTVDNLSFSYQEEEILRGVQYTFQKGKFYILSGASGCGKSTLLKIIARLLPVRTGNVYWNQKNLSFVTRDSIYQRLSYVSQHKRFFDGTIRENICTTRMEDGDYQNILDQSFLKEVFQKNSINDEQRIETDGEPLSSGERQMVSFANVLYMQRQLILLDEVFSAVDPAKEKHFFKQLKRLTEEGHTVILISHRLTNFEMADCILFMENGRIKESGTLEELCSSKLDFAKWYQMNQEGMAK